MLDVTPSYLSRIEAGVVPPPKEEKILKLAELLDLNSDQLLASADKVSSDLLEIIRQDPIRMADIIRTSASAAAATIHCGLVLRPHSEQARMSTSR
jgi:transcriptional regulator with XRE-family HTH domain